MDDDWLSEQFDKDPKFADVVNLIYPIMSLKDLRVKFIKNIVLNWVLAFIGWILLWYISWKSAIVYYYGNRPWFLFEGTALVALLSLLYTVQAFNPVVHDQYAHWINLRTGSNNLNHGCKIH